MMPPPALKCVPWHWLATVALAAAFHHHERGAIQGLGRGDNSSVAWLIDPLISVAKVLSPWLPKTSL